MKQKQNNIGIDVKVPSETCNDSHCPFHGKLKLRGQMFEGEITSASATKTAQIEFERLFPLPKYERYEKRRTKLQVHNPPCINAKLGDKVKVIETRPISKTKNFVIIGVIK